jgi:hypothetical protein
MNMFRDRTGNTQSDQISVKGLGRTLADWAVMNTESALAAERGQLWLPHLAFALCRHRQAGAQPAAQECEARVAAKAEAMSSAGAPGQPGRPLMFGASNQSAQMPTVSKAYRLGGVN